MKYPFKHSVYTRNILTLMSGTLIAQLVAILAMPLLTRLYLPEHFGIFASYVSTISILSILATLRYENAILQPSDNLEAIDLVHSSLIIAVIFSVVVLIFSYIFNDLILKLIQSKKINHNSLLLLPVGVVIIAIQAVLMQWMNRNKNYKEMGLLRCFQAISIIIFSIIFGYWPLLENGLLVGYLFGCVISVTYVFKSYYPKKNISFKYLLNATKKYIRYPLLDLPASLLNALSNYLPVILITTYMGSIYGGLYFMVERVLKAPTSIISASIGGVFRQAAIEEKYNLGNFESIFKRTAKKLILIGLPIFIFIFFCAPSLFVLALGEDWLQAGKFAQILSPMFFVAFVASPLSYSFYVANKLKYDLIGQIAYIAGILLAIMIGLEKKDIYTAIIGISIAGTLIYLAYFLMSYKLAREK